MFPSLNFWKQKLDLKAILAANVNILNQEYVQEGVGVPDFFFKNYACMCIYLSFHPYEESLV